MNKILDAEKKDNELMSYNTFRILRYVCNEIDTMIDNGCIKSSENVFEQNAIEIDKDVLLSILHKDDISPDEMKEISRNIIGDVKAHWKANKTDGAIPISRVLCDSRIGKIIIRINPDYVDMKLNCNSLEFKTLKL